MDNRKGLSYPLPLFYWIKVIFMNSLSDIQFINAKLWSFRGLFLPMNKDSMCLLCLIECASEKQGWSFHGVILA